MRLKIIVPINTSAYNERILSAATSVVGPDVEVTIENITTGTKCIESRYHFTLNGPHVVELAKKTEAEGFDGIFVTDMDFCGVDAAREAVKIPVMNAFQANAYTAMMVASRFSIITILPNVVAMQREHIHAFGITDNFASIRVVNLPVGELDPQVAIEKVYAESLKAIDEDGAEAIILGCTGFVGVAHPVTELLAKANKPAPVLDPNQIGISYLELLVRNKLAQSKLTYMTPSSRCTD